MAKKPKQVEEKSYKDCKIRIETGDVTQDLKIDGKKVTYDRDSDTGAYVSPEAPYEEHGSLEELAQAVVNKRGE